MKNDFNKRLFREQRIIALKAEIQLNRYAVAALTGLTSVIPRDSGSASDHFKALVTADANLEELTGQGMVPPETLIEIEEHLHGQKS